MEVRMAVTENILSDPSLVTEKDCEEYLFQRGKGWVGEWQGNVVGFSIVDLKNSNVWALFIHPDHEKKRFGSRLHKTMLDWYFSKSDFPLWLGTDPNTRAEQFYRRKGWKAVGARKNGEVKFEMAKMDWEAGK